MISAKLRFLTALAGFLALGPIPLPARAAESTPIPKKPGDQWEVTSQMSMEGMPMQMPAQKSKVCSPKEWKEPPAPMNDRQKCQNSDFKVTGAKATWKVVCTSPAMTGEGEITRDGAEAYSGTIKFTSEEGNMTLKLSGKRIGPCEL